MALRYLAAALAAMGALVAGGTPAGAQSTRTWVSGGAGSDSNPCSRSAPCQTFAGAISKTAAGGEIDCLDPGGFGVLTITKAITLKCDSPSNGGILAAGSNGITINAGATDAIVLSGLDFEGLNSGLNGVSFVSGGSLTIINSSIRDFVQDGISFAPGSNAALHVARTTIVNSGQSGSYAGLYIRPSGAATVTVTVTGSQVSEAMYGIVADGSATTGAINGLIRDSDISNNSQNGIATSNGTAAHSTLMLDHVSVSGSGSYGLSATGTNAGMLVGDSSVFGNRAGLSVTWGGVLVSYGTNRINGNYGADGSFSYTIGTR